MFFFFARGRGKFEVGVLTGGEMGGGKRDGEKGRGSFQLLGK